MKEKNYVPNAVFRFSVWFQEVIDITVYTKPLPEVPYENEEQYMKDLYNQEEFVQSKYFTKERIEELKEKFIRKIRESENPFNIHCVDTDSGYKVTEEQLFNLE